MLLESHGEDIEGATQRLRDYINLCMDTVVPVRTVSNKPWATSEVRALKNRNQEEMKQVQQELKICLKQ